MRNDGKFERWTRWEEEEAFSLLTDEIEAEFGKLEVDWKREWMPLRDLLEELDCLHRLSDWKAVSCLNLETLEEQISEVSGVFMEWLKGWESEKREGTSGLFGLDLGAESARSSARIAIFSTKGVGSVGRGREGSGSVLQ